MNASLLNISLECGIRISECGVVAEDSNHRHQAANCQTWNAWGFRATFGVGIGIGIATETLSRATDFRHVHRDWNRY